MNNNPIFDEFEKGEATNKIFKGVYSGQIFEADELNGINVEDIKTAVSCFPFRIGELWHWQFNCSEQQNRYYHR